MNSSVIASLFFLFAYLYFIPNISAEKTEKLIIYQTSDIHSQIEGESQGWLNLAQTINKHRKESEKQNSLLIDCGDTLPGSIIGSLSKGEAALAILNTLEYDAWIIGNHDLEFGFKTLKTLSRRSDTDILAANLKSNDGNQFLEWKIYTRNGINAAIIGLTSPHIDEWLWGNKRKQFQVLPTLQTIENIMPDILKSEPDVIILAIHHGRFSPKRLKGFNISRIAEKFPQIDLILGGHSHQDVPGEKCGKSTWYVETGCHAEKFGWIEVTVDTENRNVLEIRSKLITADNSIEIAPDLKQKIAKWEEKAKSFSKRRVGFTDTEIVPTKRKELFGPMQETFCNAIAKSAHTEIAFHGSVVSSAKFAKNITEKDIFNAIPYEDTVCILELTPSELHSVIREQIVNRDKGRFQSPFGINILIDKNSSFSVTLPTGEELKNDQRYKCAFSSYSLAGAGGRFPVLKRIASQKNSKGKDTGITVRDALRAYIKRNSPLDINAVNRIRRIE